LFGWHRFLNDCPRPVAAGYHTTIGLVEEAKRQLMLHRGTIPWRPEPPEPGTRRAVETLSDRRDGSSNALAASKSNRPSPKTQPSKRSATKLDAIVTSLRQRKGATIGELMDATGWQAHSVRGAISGALKKRMSLNVVSTAVDGRGRVYRIEAQPSK
jgi:hypothetical protein